MVYKAFAAALSAGALMVSAAALASPASDKAAALADGLKPMVGQTTESGLKITAIRAEGETLVMQVDGQKGWRGDKTAAELSDSFVSGFCSSGAEMFQSGLKIRVETTEDGGNAKLTGPTVDRCPAG